VLTVFSFLGVIVVVVLAHELGHFATAKLFRVRVEEAGLFFPPRLFAFKRGETTYSINALPLGGFVKMSGEEDPEAPGSLAAKRIPIRLLVFGAGPLMNFLLPILLLSIAFMVPFENLVGQVEVVEVAADSPAEMAGIETGDVILSVDGKEVRNTNDLSRYLYLKLGSPVTLTVRRGEASVVEAGLVPRWKPPEGEGAVGVGVTTTSAAIVRESYPFWRAVPMALGRSVEILLLFKNGVIGIISGAMPFDLRGPVGIAQMTGEVARAGISPLLEFAALISINLGLINLFPLPALDGGRIAFVLLELVRRGKRLSPRKEWLIHTVGFFLLIAAMLAVTFQDVLRLIGGEGGTP